MASRGKPKNSGMKSLAEQFSAITGATEEVGLSLLEACNGNLEMAIGMQLEGAVDVGDGGASAGPSGTTSGPSNQGDAGQMPDIPPDDNVRAPIPQKREILVQDVPTFGPRPRRRGGQMSIFDKFRDFQAETRHQEAMIRNQGNQVPQSAKIRTLEDLFRPPVDLMHKGTFNTARDAGQSQGRWLLVNVQDVQEFNCQKLNRDVWSDPIVRSVITESFVFWQVYHDSDEGRRYQQFYRVSEFPHVAILDPRTGELLASWDKLDSLSFCDLVTEFLSNHPCFDKDTLSSPPAKRARTTKSILDASEDSQLEAAIAASLADSSTSSSPSSSQDTQPIKDDPAPVTLKTAEDTINLSDDDVVNDESGNEEDVIVNVEGNSSPGSDSDCVVEAVTKTKSSKETTEIHDLNNASVTRTEGTSSSARDASTEHASLSANGTDKNDECQRTKGVNHVSNHENDEIEDVKKKVPPPLKENDVLSETGLKNGKTEDNTDGQSQAKLMLRFPDGRKKQLSLSEDTSLLTLVKLVGKEGFSNERFEMVTNFPRRKLSYMDFDKTLKEAGLCPQETIFIQER